MGKPLQYPKELKKIPSIIRYKIRLERISGPDEAKNAMSDFFLAIVYTLRMILNDTVLANLKTVNHRIISLKVLIVLES